MNKHLLVAFEKTKRNTLHMIKDPVFIMALIGGTYWHMAFDQNNITRPQGEGHKTEKTYFDTPLNDTPKIIRDARDSASDIFDTGKRDSLPPVNTFRPHPYKTILNRPR